MQLTKEQAAEYRQRVARIEALRQIAQQEATQSNQLRSQSYEHRTMADLLERELYQAFLPEIEQQLGLSAEDAHYVEEALQVRTEVKPKPEEKPE